MDKIANDVRETAIFRVVQEALTNVMRHAAASQVNVSLKIEGGDVIIEVRDDGIGIMENQVSGTTSLGLIGIRERVRLLEGDVEISGKPGEGTLVRVILPVGEEANPNA